MVNKAAEERQKELVHTIKDAIYDAKVRQTYRAEFAESIENLLKELKQIEDESPGLEKQHAVLEKEYKSLVKKPPVIGA